MKTFQHIVMLLTCIVIVAVGSMQRDKRLLGHDLKPKATVTADTVPTLTTNADTLIVNTTELGKDIVGYAGPVPLEIKAADGRIVSVSALPNHETPEFFGRASVLLTKWNGKTVAQAKAVKVDAVSGATYSSGAIIGNMQKGLEVMGQATAVKPWYEKMDLSAKGIAALIVVLMAALLPLWIKSKRYRTVQLVLNVAVLGLWCGTFLDWTLMVSMMSNGVDVWKQLVPIVMLLTAFIYPLFGKKSYYCTNVCPFGSAQFLMGKASKKKWKMSARLVKGLTWFRRALWAVLMVLMLSGVWFEWMDYELFTAFIFTSAQVVVIVLAVVMLLLAIFVPQPYCRFICPTGTLFKVAQATK